MGTLRSSPRSASPAQPRHPGTHVDEELELPLQVPVFLLVVHFAVRRPVHDRASEQRPGPEPESRFSKPAQSRLSRLGFRLCPPGLQLPASPAPRQRTPTGCPQGIPGKERRFQGLRRRWRRSVAMKSQRWRTPKGALNCSKCA